MKAKNEQAKPAEIDERTEMVQIRANPACFRSRGQVVLSADGVDYLVTTDRPLEVSREVYEKLKKHDVRGRQAIVLD